MSRYVRTAPARLMERQPAGAVESPKERAIRLGTFALAVLGLLLLVAELPRQIDQLLTNGFADVHAYYDAAARLNAGEPLYPTGADVNAAEFYRYPPLLAIAFRPFVAVLPFTAVAWLWEAVLLGAFVVTLRRLAPRPGFRRAVAILAFPIVWSLAIGQAQVLVTWLLVLASPLSVALAGQLKVFPALAAIYFVGIRDWRWLRRFVTWCLALAVFQLVLEPRGSLAFLGTVSLAQVGQVNNLSLYALSPALWAVACLVAAIVTLRLARTRWGWLAAVSFSVVTTPRLLLYLLMTCLAGLRESPTASERAGDARPS